MWVLCVFGLASEHSIHHSVSRISDASPSGRYAWLGQGGGGQHRPEHGTFNLNTQCIQVLQKVCGIYQQPNTQTCRAEYYGTYVKSWRFGTRSFTYTMHLRVPIEEPIQRSNYTSTVSLIVIIKKRKFSKASKLATTHEASHWRMQLLILDYCT